MPPLEGPDGTALSHHYVGYGLFTNTVVFFDGNPYPEATMRWFDSWYDGGEFAFQSTSGKRGVHWDVDEDGFFAPAEAPEGTSHTRYNAFSQFFGHIVFDSEAKQRIGGAITSIEDDTEVYLNYAPEEPWIPQWIVPTPEEADYLSLYEEELMLYVHEFMGRAIFSDMDIDAEWADFLDQCERLRAPEILEIKQAQYVRYISG